MIVLDVHVNESQLPPSSECPGASVGCLAAAAVAVGHSDALDVADRVDVVGLSRKVRCRLRSPYLLLEQCVLYRRPKAKAANRTSL